MIGTFPEQHFCPLRQPFLHFCLEHQKPFLGRLFGPSFVVYQSRGASAYNSLQNALYIEGAWHGAVPFSMLCQELLRHRQ